MDATSGPRTNKSTSRLQPLTEQEITELVNDSDSDGYELEELDELDQNEEILHPEPPVPLQNEPARGRKRRKPPTDSELGWTLNIDATNKPAFSGHPGPNLNLDISADSTPLDIFSLFFTPEILSTIQTETNRYASQQIKKKQQEGSLKKKSIYALWKDVSLQEIKIFFAIVIHMSLVKKPQLRDYWSTLPILQSSYTTSLGMSRDRFLSILAMLHLNDNNTRIAKGQPGYDPTHKVKPVLQTLTEKFQNSYSPYEDLTIDEAICAFRGRIFFRVYMKGKPHKYGMKIFELCEANSGYVCNMEVYTGAHEDDEAYNSSFNVVDRLCEPIKNNWHTVYMDRFFTSPTLVDHLWKSGTKVVGTVMPNRKEMPKVHFSQKIKKGEKLVAKRQHMMAIKWRDVRDVYILSSAHDDTMEETPAARGAHQKIKPTAVTAYNKKKIGVDKSDQMMSYYAFRRKSVKWWKKLFFHFFDLALVNAHILHKKQATEKYRLCIFIQKVAEGLVADVGKETRIQSPPGTGGRLLGRDHFPYRIPGSGKKKEGWAQRLCKVCSDRGKHESGKSARQYTTMYCKKCDVGLCIGECFEAYHTRANYWN